MNIATMKPIYTPFNQRTVKFTTENRRVLRNGRWQRKDAEAAKTLNWLRGEGASK